MAYIVMALPSEVRCDSASPAALPRTHAHMRTRAPRTGRLRSEHGIETLMVEGGGRVIHSFLAAHVRARMRPCIRVRIRAARALWARAGHSFHRFGLGSVSFGYLLCIYCVFGSAARRPHDRDHRADAGPPSPPSRPPPSTPSSLLFAPCSQV